MENNTSEPKEEPPKRKSGDEKAPDSSDNGAAKPRNVKAKKRKKPKDSTAPRHPLTGYIRYLNDRRESVRSANPNLPFAEITKILASEWSSLPMDRKQQYLDAAEQDRERYTREYNAYKQTDAYRMFKQQQSEKKLKENRDEPKPNVSSQPVVPKEQQQQNSADLVDLGNFDIPIFTEEFLDHNKTRDAELRHLRKSNTDYEQQNAILQKHIESMKSAIEKLETEIMQQKRNNGSLQQHLDHLRATLTKGFAGTKLPGVNEQPSLQTIDEFMGGLHSRISGSGQDSSTLLQIVRDIVGRLEFNG